MENEVAAECLLKDIKAAKRIERSRPCELLGLEPLMEESEQSGCSEFSCHLTITTEDRLRGAIIEALTWMQQGSPGRAHNALQEALKLWRIVS
jgi:c-di-GMP-related signal transduction protein